jgi:hypothetical protein
MIEITKYVADDGTEFEDRFECTNYENKLSLNRHRDEFALFDENICPLSLEDVETEDIYYIVVRHPCGAIALGKWLTAEGDVNPFEFYETEKTVGTWAFTDSMGWIKLEDEVHRYVGLIAELNK